MIRRTSYSLILVAVTAAVLVPGAQVRAAQPASLVPQDAVAFIAIPSFDQLIAQFKKTSTQKLYEDPAMQEFIRPAEEKVREKLQEAVAEAWREHGIQAQPPKDIPLPRGQAVVSMRMVRVTSTMPNLQWDPDKQQVVEQGTREVTTAKPAILAAIDMGENLGKLKESVERIVNAGVDQEEFRRRRSQSHGTELINLLAPTERVEAGQRDDLTYAYAGSHFVVSYHPAGESTDAAKFLLRQLGGDSGQPSMAGNADLTRAMRAVGDGQMQAYANIEAIIAQARQEAGPEQQQQIDKMLGVFGVDNVPGVAMSVALAPEAGIDSRTRALALVNGERKGIVKLLAPGAKPTKPAGMIQRGTTVFLQAFHNLGETVEMILAMASQATGQPLMPMVQGMMAATGSPDGSGPPPVDLRKDVLSQLVGPVTFVSELNKPYTDADSTQGMLAVGVQNAQVLTQAFSRIHNVFIARGNTEMQRKLRDQTIFLLPPGALQMPMMMGGVQPGAQPGQPPQPQAGLTVTDKNLLVGPVGAIEQSIRNKDRQDVQPITADPMYQHAARHLPATADLFAYANDRVQTAAFWAQIRQAAQQTGDGQDQPARQMSMNPMMSLVEQTRDYVDYSKLPPFERVEKHFGASVSYLKGTEDGLLMESFSVQPAE